MTKIIEKDEEMDKEMGRSRCNVCKCVLLGEEGFTCKACTRLISQENIKVVTQSIEDAKNVGISIGGRIVSTLCNICGKNRCEHLHIKPVEYPSILGQVKVQEIIVCKDCKKQVGFTWGGSCKKCLVGEKEEMETLTLSEARLLPMFRHVSWAPDGYVTWSDEQSGYVNSRGKYVNINDLGSEGYLEYKKPHEPNIIQWWRASSVWLEHNDCITTENSKFEKTKQLVIDKIKDRERQGVKIVSWETLRSPDNWVDLEEDINYGEGLT